MFYLSKISSPIVWSVYRYSTVKDKLYPVPPTSKKEVQCSVGLLGFWRQHILHLGLFPLPIHQVAQKEVSFEWELEQESDLKQALDALTLGLYDWLTVPEVSLADTVTVWGLQRAAMHKSLQRLGI